MKTRYCNRCGENKPETAEFFGVHAKSPKGLLSTCKVCVSVDRKAKYHVDPDHFQLAARSSYARHREERKAAKRAAYAANPELAKARAATYRKANPKKRSEINAKYRAIPKNRERARLRSLKFAADHREEARERSRKWLRDHPDERRAQGAIKRARKRGAEGVHTADDVLHIYKQQKSRCYYCKVKLAGTYHVDHKTPLIRGGSNWPDNICCACPPCNLAKHDMTEAEFRRSQFRVVKTA